MVRKEDKDSSGKERIHFGFCFPDVYEVGMSNLALRIIYALLNEEEDVYCERIFSPAADMRKIMMNNQIPPFSLETRRKMKDFEILGFTLQYELSYLTVLDMLNMADIPVWQCERGEEDPLIIAGGPCVFNPEPVADFFDLFMIGEGEELLLELMDLYREYRKQKYSKKVFLQKAACLEGIYVPSLYQPVYTENGHFLSLKPLTPNVPAKVRKRIIKDMDGVYTPLNVLVPNTEIVHDRVFLELYRGCGSGCRFCQAGMIYRPVREKSLETLVAQAEKMMETSGYEEIGLLSLSSGDYSEIEKLCDILLAKYEDEHINLSLPSLRLDSVSMDLLDRASRTRKTGLTFAPEAGTQEARDRINKNILRSDLLQTACYAFEKGFERIKLYFMLGLPGERDEDIEGIARLCYELIDLWQDYARRSGKKRKFQITVSTSFFIPKPWTAFQWSGQISREEMHRRQRLLAGKLRSRMITYQWHGFESSEIEACLAKGDRRMAAIIYDVHKQGGWLEGESKEFSYERWTDAFSRAGFAHDEFIQSEIPLEAPLPWSFIDTGIEESFLKREYERAKQGLLSPNCRDACFACGASGFASGVCVERGVV